MIHSLFLLTVYLPSNSCSNDAQHAPSATSQRCSDCNQARFREFELQDPITSDSIDPGMAASTDEAPAPIGATTEATELVKTVEANGTAAESCPVVEAQLTPFKEESNFVSDLKDSEKKALQELKIRVEEAILKNEFEPPTEISEIKDGATKETEVEKLENDKVTEEVKANETVSEAGIKADVAEETEVTVTEKAADERTVEEVPKPKETTALESVTAVTENVEVATPTVENVPASETARSEAATAEKEAVGANVTEESLETVAGKTDVKDVYLWGVPLLHTRGDERTDVILLKFLRARDFKVNEAFTMLKNTILWRKSFKTETILEEDFGNDLDGVAYMNGYDKEGHPVCYNVYGVFEDKELYQKTFGNEEKREKFLRWRVQLLEKGIEQLSFRPGGVNSMVQITDLKNSPGLGKTDLRQATKQALALLQDNYPEFVARKIFINVPWWYFALSTMISPFVTQRTKSKFVIARPSRVTETLFKYISPEYVPVQYGGLKRENDEDFSGAEGGVSELVIKAGAKQIIDIPATEVGTTLVWDLIVLGWEVSYKEEFIPNAEGSYTIIIQKSKKMAAHEEPVRSSYKIGEPGKIVLTIENTSSRKKRLVYRSKVKSEECVTQL